MTRKDIRLTKHAADRCNKYDLGNADIERIVTEGERRADNGSKTRYILRVKQGTLIAVCSETETDILVLTVTMGGGKRR